MIELLKNMFGPLISAVSGVMSNLSNALGVDVSWGAIVTGYKASEYNDRLDAVVVAMAVAASAQADRMDQHFHEDALKEAQLHPAIVRPASPESSPVQHTPTPESSHPGGGEPLTTPQAPAENQNQPPAENHPVPQEGQPVTGPQGDLNPSQMPPPEQTGEGVPEGQKWTLRYPPFPAENEGPSRWDHYTLGGDKGGRTLSSDWTFSWPSGPPSYRWVWESPPSPSGQWHLASPSWSFDYPSDDMEVPSLKEWVWDSTPATRSWTWVWMWPQTPIVSHGPWSRHTEHHAHIWRPLEGPVISPNGGYWWSYTWARYYEVVNLEYPMQSSILPKKSLSELSQQQ